MRTRPLLLAAVLTTGLLTALPAEPAAAAPARYADDFDGDGYRDVAVGAAGAVVAGKQTAGAVVVLYGSPSGPSAARPAVITQNSPGVPGTAEEGDQFGAALTAGDLDGDGYADVAVGAQNEDVGGRRNTGAVTVLYGSAAGLTTTGAATYTQATAGVPGAAESRDWFGSAVRLADLDGDGRADLAATAYGENDASGALWVLRGTASGLTTKGARTVSARQAGLRGQSDFGWTLAP